MLSAEGRCPAGEGRMACGPCQMRTMQQRPSALLKRILQVPGQPSRASPSRRHDRRWSGRRACGWRACTCSGTCARSAVTAQPETAAVLAPDSPRAMPRIRSRTNSAAGMSRLSAAVLTSSHSESEKRMPLVLRASAAFSAGARLVSRSGGSDSIMFLLRQEAGTGPARGRFAGNSGGDLPEFGYQNDGAFATSR